MPGVGRPPLAVGTYGKIGFSVSEGPPVRVRARTKFRDFDGVARQVTRWGPSRAAAERALKVALGRTGRSTATAATTSSSASRRVSELTGILVNTLRWPRSRSQGPPSYKLCRSVKYWLSDALEWMEEQYKKDNPRAS